MGHVCVGGVRGAVVGARCAVPGVVFVPCSVVLLFRLAACVLGLCCSCCCVFACCCLTLLRLCARLSGVTHMCMMPSAKETEWQLLAQRVNRTCMHSKERRRQARKP
jgi:hypothetical protein